MDLKWLFAFLKKLRFLVRDLFIYSNGILINLFISAALDSIILSEDIE